MEKEDIISVQWAQEDVETSYNLLKKIIIYISNTTGMNHLKKVNWSLLCISMPEDESFSAFSGSLLCQISRKSVQQGKR